jgi:hypothetical protein
MPAATTASVAAEALAALVAALLGQWETQGWGLTTVCASKHMQSTVHSCVRYLVLCAMVIRCCHNKCIYPVWMPTVVL